eukprot:COSAG01_NODE_165_length_23303_cov_269.524953_19_plen_128_part_00
MIKKFCFVFFAFLLGFVIAFIQGAIFLSYITYLFVNDRKPEMKAYLSRIWRIVWMGTVFLYLQSVLLLVFFNYLTLDFFGPSLLKLGLLFYGFAYLVIVAFISFSVGVFWVKLHLFYKTLFKRNIVC